MGELNLLFFLLIFELNFFFQIAKSLALTLADPADKQIWMRNVNINIWTKIFGFYFVILFHESFFIKNESEYQRYKFGMNSSEIFTKPFQWHSDDIFRIWNMHLPANFRWNFSFRNCPARHPLQSATDLFWQNSSALTLTISLLYWTFRPGVFGTFPTTFRCTSSSVDVSGSSRNLIIFISKFLIEIFRYSYRHLPADIRQYPVEGRTTGDSTECCWNFHLRRGHENFSVVFASDFFSPENLAPKTPFRCHSVTYPLSFCCPKI